MQILPIASGKGGVGKSVTAVNLAGELVRLGKQVILFDFDLGGANLHTLLGVRNDSAGLGNFIYKQVGSIEPLVQETDTPGLKFVAGDCLYPGTPNLDFFTKKKLMRELAAMPGDYALLDLGAGSTYNILDFYLMTRSSILVTTAEITSILNAYSFLKAAVFRFMTGQFSTKSEERGLINESIRSNRHGADFSVLSVLDELCEKFPESGGKAREEIGSLRPQIIVNRGKNDQDLEMAKRLRDLVRAKLNVQVDFIGFLPEDSAVPISVARRQPLFISAPDGSFVSAARACAKRIASHAYGLNEGFAASDEYSEGDLETLKNEFDEKQA